MTDCGLKQIKDLKRGDMILTNDGYQPLAELDVGFNPSDKLLMSKLKTTDFMVKIPKDFFIENVPSEDVYVTKTHPLSMKKSPVLKMIKTLNFCICLLKNF